jgi:ribosome-associated protein
VRELEIESESITLAQLLKLANLVGSGGEARQFLAETVVRVNGEPDARRGRKLRPGDVVEAAGESIRVTAAG